jgi:hypothetical protein
MLYLLSEATSQGQLAGVIAVLGSAIAILWKHSIARTEAAEERLKAALEKCEIGHQETATKREEDQIYMRELTGKVGKHEGMFIGHEQARSDLRSLSDHVLTLLAKDGIDAANATSNGSNIVSSNPANNLVGDSGIETLGNPGT